MAQGQRVGFPAAQKTDIWSRWTAGQSLHVIGRSFGKLHTSIHSLLSHRGEIVPAVRRHSLLVLTATKREDISRGLASGSSIREIAECLERAASTVSREMARLCVLCTEPMKLITKPGSRPRGPSCAFLRSMVSCRGLLRVN